MLLQAICKQSLVINSEVRNDQQCITVGLKSDRTHATKIRKKDKTYMSIMTRKQSAKLKYTDIR